MLPSVMSVYPPIEESIAERRSRLIRESAELERDELKKENARLKAELRAANPQGESKKVG